MGERHRVRLGDQFRAIGFSDTVVQLQVRVLVQFDNGRLREFPRKLTTTGDRVATAEVFGNMEADGRVVRANITRITPATKRGQTYVVLSTRDRNAFTIDDLCRDYQYEGSNVALDTFVDPGPGGGNGFITKRVIADDVTPIDIEHTLGISNALRRIDGFIWYYHCSGDVADRTLRVSARDFGEGLPTGMTSGGNTLIQVFPTAAVTTLSANQEGTIYVSAQSGSRISISLDNGTKITEDTSVAAPLPFPYWANENDVGELFFDVVDAEAADRHSIYIIEEAWIDP